MLKGTNKNHTKLFFHQVTCHKSVKNWCTLTSVCISTILRHPLTWLNQSHFTAGTISFIMRFFSCIGQSLKCSCPLCLGKSWISTFNTDANVLHNYRLALFTHSVIVRIWWFSGLQQSWCVLVCVKRHFGSFSCLWRMSKQTSPVWLTGDDTGLNKAVISVFHHLEVESCMTGNQ